MTDNYRGRIPRIRWGTGYVNALDLDGFDEPNTWSEPLEGSEFALSPSRAEDAWIVADDYKLEGVARWIPREDVLIPRRATGWGGSSGWDAALRWMRQKNTMKFHPDSRNLIVSPAMNADTIADGVVDDFSVDEGTIAGTTTPALDGADGAQKVTITGNGTGLTATVVVSQDVGGIVAGEALTLSAEGRHQLSVAGANSALSLQALDAASAVLAASAASPNFANAGVYGVQSCSLTTPASTARVRARYVITVPNTGSITAWVRKMMLSRAGSIVYLANPSHDAVLVEPMRDKPGLEMNHRRAVRLVLRSPSGVAFEGY